MQQMFIVGQAGPFIFAKGSPFGKAKIEGLEDGPEIENKQADHQWRDHNITAEDIFPGDMAATPCPDLFYSLPPLFSKLDSCRFHKAPPQANQDHSEIAA